MNKLIQKLKIKKTKSKEELGEMLYVFVYKFLQTQNVNLYESFKIDGEFQEKFKKLIELSKLNQDEYLDFIRQLIENKSCFKQFCKNNNGLELLTNIFTDKRQSVPDYQSESIRNTPALELLTYINPEYLISVYDDLQESNLVIWVNFNAKFPIEYCNNQKAVRLCKRVIQQWKDKFKQQRVNTQNKVIKANDDDDDQENENSDSSDNQNINKV